jgi:hypothetical protein
MLSFKFKTLEKELEMGKEENIGKKGMGVI